jgi:hypothetical protein
VDTGGDVEPTGACAPRHHQADGSLRPRGLGTRLSRRDPEQPSHAVARTVGFQRRGWHTNWHTWEEERAPRRSPECCAILLLQHDFYFNSRGGTRTPDPVINSPAPPATIGVPARPRRAEGPLGTATGDHPRPYELRLKCILHPAWHPLLLEIPRSIRQQGEPGSRIQPLKLAAPLGHPAEPRTGLSFRRRWGPAPCATACPPSRADRWSSGPSSTPPPRASCRSCRRSPRSPARSRDRR